MTQKEINDIVNELVERIVLYENFHDTFHPNAHPLYAHLGYMNFKKRSREYDEQPNKKQRTDSMHTHYDSDEMTENILSLHDENVHPLQEFLPDQDYSDWKSERYSNVGLTSWKKKDSNDYINIFDDGSSSICICTKEYGMFRW